tara:strand:+ start:294 stop:728 length:435 start_codon:yes stop_codon:yes gene_type:complete
MSWRSVQLGTSNCDQDEVILNLYKNVPVNYIGTDTEFAQKLTLDPLSNHAVAVFNQKAWMSELVEFIQTLKKYKSFYLGINRYVVLGNNTNITFNTTDSEGQSLLGLVHRILPDFNMIDSGTFDNDQGKYFNFVQPLTWIYGTN